MAALGQDARLSDSTGAALLKEAGSVVGSHRQGVAGNQSRVRGYADAGIKKMPFGSSRLAAVRKSGAT